MPPFSCITHFPMAPPLAPEEKELLDIANKVARECGESTQWSTWHFWDYYRRKTGGVAGEPHPPVSAETIWKETGPFGSCVDIAFQTTKALRDRLSSKPELSRYARNVRTLARASSDINPDLMHCITALSEETFCIVIDFSCNHEAMHIPLHKSVDSMPYHNMNGRESVDQLSYRQRSDGSNVIERTPKTPVNEWWNVTHFKEYSEAELIEKISIRLAEELERGTRIPKTKTVKYKSYLGPGPLHHDIPHVMFNGKVFATTCRIKIEFAQQRILMQVPLGDWLKLPEQRELYREAKKAKVFVPVNAAVRNLALHLVGPRHLSPLKEQIEVVSKIGQKHGMKESDFYKMIDSIYDVQRQARGPDCPG